MTSPPPSSITLQRAKWPEDRDALYLIRHEVFIVEQEVPEEIEVDEWDAPSLHILAVSDKGEPVGCGRLLPTGKIGRMAVRKPWRGTGVGRLLLEALLQEARQQEMSEIQLSAQTQAAGFYASLGFQAYGPTYEEAGIPHQKMALTLSPQKK